MAVLPYGAVGSETVISHATAIYPVASVAIKPVPDLDTSEPPTPTLGQIWPRGNLAISMGGGGGSVPPAARQTTAITTASLANNAQATGTVTLSKSYRLLKLETNVASRIRLYSTVAKRDADLARPAGTDPTGDHGLMFDFVTTAPVLTYGANQSVYTTQVPDQYSNYNGVVNGSDIVFAVAGRITALRHYRGSSATQTSTALHIWDNSGNKLADATTSGESGTGWQTVTLATPISVTAGQKVRVSIDIATGSAQPGYVRVLNQSTLVNGNLQITQEYQHITAAGTRPTSTTIHGSMVDVVFQEPLPPASPSADLSPTVDGFDGKTTPDGLIPYTITNLSGSSAAVTATLTWISTE